MDSQVLLPKDKKQLENILESRLKLYTDIQSTYYEFVYEMDDTYVSVHEGFNNPSYTRLVRIIRQIISYLLKEYSYSACDFKICT